MNTPPTNPCVVEIVGVAGAGKSTLVRTLVARHERLRVDDTLHTRQPRHWPAALRGAIRSLPLIVTGSIGPRRLRWDEVRFMLYVAGWSRRLTRRRLDDECLLIDQGPIFSLARLRVGDAGVTTTAAYRRWEAAMIDEWARVLGVVVWLDADDRVITLRINRRGQRHEIKGTSPDHVERFLSDYRRCFDEIIGRVERAPRGPRVVRVDSSLVEAPELGDEVEQILGLGRLVPDRTRVTGVDP
jgi:thymidylate kinase